MYLEHFGMREPPFSITPDTDFCYNHGSHQEAFNTLLVALRTGEGFIKVTGEVGTGKTLLCRKLLNTLGDEFVTAYIPNPFLTPTALRMALADELGISFARNIGQHRVLKLINERLVELATQGKRAVLLLDEAQALPNDSLEALRLLTNLETEKRKLLQVVLFGQPELDRHLAQPEIRQLKQRITFSYRLAPLDRTGVDGYVAHRLLVAGYHGKPLFEARALTAAFRATGGTPRLLNVLCHKALMLAYGRGASRVERADVHAAAQDTEYTAGNPRIRRPGLLYGMVGVAAALATSAGLFYLWAAS